MRKKLATVTALRELTVTKMVTASRDWAVTWAVIELWSSRDHTEDAVIELWPRRDLAVNSPSRDWAVIIGPRSRDHRELTVSIYFLMGYLLIHSWSLRD